MEEPPLTFEAALDELEALVRRLESGELGLEEALRHYERGVGLLSGCQEQLDRVERRVEMLTGVDAEGQPITRPFDEGPGTEPEDR